MLTTRDDIGESMSVIAVHVNYPTKRRWRPSRTRVSSGNGSFSLGILRWLEVEVGGELEATQSEFRHDGRPQQETPAWPSSSDKLLASHRRGEGHRYLRRVDRILA